MTGLGADRAAANAVGGGASGFRRSAYWALCHDPAASVPTAPAMQTITTIKAVCPGAATATTPPAASITAAANCVGAIARSASAVGSAVGVWNSDQLPNRADAAAAHMHSTPARNIRSPYEAADESAHRAPCGPVFLLGLIAT